MDLLKRALAWMNGPDEGTWFGHWLQGLGGFWLGYLPVQWLTDLPAAPALAVGVLSGFLLVAAVFAHREGSNLLDGIKKYGARLAVRKKGLDGLMDWILPALGCFADINLLYGGFGAFAGSIFGTAAFYGVVLLARRTK